MANIRDLMRVFLGLSPEERTAAMEFAAKLVQARVKNIVAGVRRETVRVFDPDAAFVVELQRRDKELERMGFNEQERDVIHFESLQKMLTMARGAESAATTQEGG